MNWVDRAIATFSPLAALRRAQAREILARYDAAKPSRTRNVTRDNSTGEIQVSRDAATARAIARDMERNHDLIRGALSTLVRNVVGPNGIGIEPQPRTKTDDIDDDFARQILTLWRDFERCPEVTRTLDWQMSQELACRTWLRDGEVFSQVLEGPVPMLDHGTIVPFSIELLEPDMVPLDYQQDGSAVVEAGIERNAWGKPTAFYVFKTHPGGGRAALSESALKRVPAERMLHLAIRDRLTGLRGISQLVSATRRVEDVKDYEDSERIAARMAAAIACFVKRDVNMDWAPPPEVSEQARSFRLNAGAVFDKLLPGESIEMLNPNRPNTNLEKFRESQLRAASAGMEVGYSSLARNYNGTYSAQRQELVEQWTAYQMLTSKFVARWVRPIWERFVATAIASGALRVPSHIRPETVAQAEFRGPPMPWINPNHEAEALESLVRNGFRSATSVISERGGRMQTTYEQLARERRLAAELGLVLDCDAGAAPRAQAAPAASPPPAAADVDEAVANAAAAARAGAARLNRNHTGVPSHA